MASLIFQVTTLCIFFQSYICIKLCQDDHQPCKGKQKCCNKLFQCDFDDTNTCCVLKGTKCESTDQCCRYYYCDGTCEECIQTNSKYVCHDDRECCKGLCFGNKCVPCFGGGSWCDTSYQCCGRLFCDNNECVSCIQPGRPCSRDDLCCTHACVQGVCSSCGAVGAQCNEPSNCCSGRCTKHLCLCTHVVHGRCVFNQDCCDKMVCGLVLSGGRGMLACKSP